MALEATAVPADAFTAVVLPPAPPTVPPATAAPTASAVTVDTRPDLILDVPVGPPRSTARPHVKQPTPVAHVTVKPKPKPKPKAKPKPASVRHTSFGHVATGTPTYYCWAGRSRCTRGHPDVAGNQMYAAAGPSLRVGNWRGRVVTVSASNGRSIQVKLIDWCACGGDHFIDLYHDAFVALGAPRRATVRW